MRRLIVLGAVLAAFIVAWGVQRWQQGRLVASAPARTLSVHPDRVTGLRITKPGSPVVAIERVAGAWRIQSPAEYRANEQVVTGVIETLDSLALVDVVSTNPAKRGTFQVDSTGTRVQVLEGDKTVLDVIVGKSSPDFSHTYLRPEGGDEVYRADGMLTYNFNKRVDDWRDKTILDIDPAGIVRLTLDYPKEKTQVVLAKRDATTWTVAAAGATPEVGDSLAVAAVLRSSAKLSTVNFATPEETATVSFAAPDFRLQIDTDAGSHTITFVEGESGKMYAQRSGEPTLFQLYKNSLANLMKKAEDLRPKKT